MTDPGDVTQLLGRWRAGDAEAATQLMPLVYDELRRQARRYLGRERPDHTLQATALVHEAYLRLIDQKQVDYQNRLHFYALAASMMRRVLVDHARRQSSVKRGGRARRVPLDSAVEISSDRAAEVVAVDEALSELEALDPELSRLVELRFFGGFGNSELSDLLGVSVPTVTRRWRMAKAWLYRHLSSETTDAS